MNSEMIRRVANAILDSGEGCLSGLAYVDPTKAARAAIEAMREPTDYMIDTCSGSHSAAVRASRTVHWRNMIAAALSSPAEDM